MRFGAHVSSSGGISRSIGRGRALGCECLQLFTHNPRTWRPINHTTEEIAAFRAQAAEADMWPLFSHGLYLINLGAPDKEVPTVLGRSRAPRLQGLRPRWPFAVAGELMGREDAAAPRTARAARAHDSGFGDSAPSPPRAPR